MKMYLVAGLTATFMMQGCQADLNSATIDGPARRIAARHDAYVNKDAALSALDKSVDLRDSAELVRILDLAKQAQLSTTQPAK